MRQSMAHANAQGRLRRGLLTLLVGAAVSVAAIACADNQADGSTEPTATSSPATATTTPAGSGTGASSNGGGTAVGDDTPVSGDGTPVPDSASPSPDTPVSSTPGGVGGSPPPTGTVTPVDPGYPTVEELAPIESVDILVMESFPPQYSVHIVSGLPSGCAQFLGAEVVERTGTTIRIEVLNRMPSPNAEIACTMIYGMHEANVMLGSDFEPRVTYTVDVNGELTEFTAQ